MAVFVDLVWMATQKIQNELLERISEIGENLSLEDNIAAREIVSFIEANIDHKLNTKEFKILRETNAVVIAEFCTVTSILINYRDKIIGNEKVDKSDFFELICAQLEFNYVLCGWKGLEVGRYPFKFETDKIALRVTLKR